MGTPLGCRHWIALGCSIHSSVRPFRAGWRLRSTEERAYWALRLSTGLACPAWNRRGTAPFANDTMIPARRRRTIPLPSETNDAATPSIQSNPAGRLEKDFSLTRSIDRGSGGAAIRTRRRSCFDRLLTRNDTSSDTPHDDAVPRRPASLPRACAPFVRDLEAPAFGASSGRNSGGSTSDHRLRGDPRSCQPFPPLPRSRVTREKQPPDP